MRLVAKGLFFLKFDTLVSCVVVVFCYKQLSQYKGMKIALYSHLYCSWRTIRLINDETISLLMSYSKLAKLRDISRHFQLNPILILEFDIGVRIMFLVDILKDNM